MVKTSKASSITDVNDLAGYAKDLAIRAKDLARCAKDFAIRAKDLAKSDKMLA